MARHRWDHDDATRLRVGPGFDLGGLDTRATPGFDGGKHAGRRMWRSHGDRLADLQEMLFAEGRDGGERSVLVVLQGMDSSGKGGIARHVLGMVDPQGVSVRSFGPPSEEERRHHYLRRIREALPPAGRIGVFDRSHYEDVLAARVLGLVPGDPWFERYGEINRFERELVDGGVAVLKCALMISPDEQLARLAKRLDRPDKHWKYSPSDIDDRARWHDYMDAYQAMLDHTSTEHAPWHVIPADRKWYARLAVTQLLIGVLEGMDLAWPEADFDVDEERRRLAALEELDIPHGAVVRDPSGRA